MPRKKSNFKTTEQKILITRWLKQRAEEAYPKENNDYHRAVYLAMLIDRLQQIQERLMLQWYEENGK